MKPPPSPLHCVPVLLSLVAAASSHQADVTLTRIIGGIPLTSAELHHRFPYTASLQWGGHRCGGTLVAEDLVLTAAHCVYVSLEEESEVPIDPSWFSSSQIIHDTFIPAIHTVQLGKLDLRPNNITTSLFATNNETTSKEETLIVQRRITHPYFSPKNRGEEPPYPDIALLKLYGSSRVTKYAKMDNPRIDSDWTRQYTLRQQQFSEENNNTTNSTTIQYQFITMGYGMDESQQISNILKQTTLTHIPNEACQSQGLWQLLHEDMLCAFGDGERDSCNGDSGGGLFWEREEDGSDLQVGIVSWGVGCADDRFSGVYTRISSHYGWIRTQICLQSRSPPAHYNCPLRASPTNLLPVSNSVLTVTLELPPADNKHLGLLVESMDDLDAEPLIDMPVGSFDVTWDNPYYSLNVQLGHRYRVVLLNSSGRSYVRGRIVAKWGDETLVDEVTQQGDLLVYAIERSFRIADLEGGKSTIDYYEGMPTQTPTSKPSNSNLFDSNNSNETSLDPNNLFKVEEPFISFGTGFHTIDPNYVDRLGYQNSTIPVEVNVTSNSFVMVKDGITISPTRGNAMSLNSSAYVLASGGSFIGSSLGNGQLSGYGIYLEDESKIDIMSGAVVKGGAVKQLGQSSAAAIHASDEASVTIRGGEFYGGANSDSLDACGLSLEVTGNATVAVYGGSFFGDWNISNGGSIVIHACSFIMLSDSVMAKLLDSTFLNVAFTSDNQSEIRVEYHNQDDCTSGVSTDDAPSKQPTTLPVSLPPTSKPSDYPSTVPTVSSTSRYPTSQPSSASPSSTPTNSPIQTSLSPARTSTEWSLPPGIIPTSSPKLGQDWGVSNLAPSDHEGVSTDRPSPALTFPFVPVECVYKNTTALCFNSKEITLDGEYAVASGFSSGIISDTVHVYNGSDVLIHITIYPMDEADAVEVSFSNITTGFGAEITGGDNSTGLVLRDHSTGKLMDGTRVQGGKNSGAAVSISEGSRIEILGGAYGGGESDNLNLGLSLSIDGIGSRVDIYGGSFFGDWFVGALCKIYLHGCDFTINNNTVQGFLKDDTALSVSVNIKVNGLLYFIDECPDTIGGLEEDANTVWTGNWDTESNMLLPQNAPEAHDESLVVDEYSYVIGPTTIIFQIELVLSEDTTSFFIDRTFFAETHSFVTDKFYSGVGKAAHDVQSEVEVIKVKQLAATLRMEITFEHTLMYRSRSRIGSSTYNTYTIDVIRGPFLREEDRLYYIKLLNRNVLGLVVADVTIPNMLDDSGTSSSSEKSSDTGQSKTLLWSLAGVFIAMLICCFGSGVMYFKQTSDIKAEQRICNNTGYAQVTEHHHVTDDRKNLVTRIYSSTSAETGVPLIPAYQSFNQDDSPSIDSHSTQLNACSISSRFTFVSANSSLSRGAEAINLEIPLGRLRMELNYSDSGWPIIQAVDISSVAYGYVNIGDRLAFIDGQDVREIDDGNIAILMDEFCNHMRRLTVFRGAG